MTTARTGTTTVDSSDTLSTLQSLPHRYFEQFVADVWQERQGWKTELTPPGSDRGIDILGEPPGEGPKTAVQAKRYAEGRKVTAPDIQQYYSIPRLREDVGSVTIVTTGGFTRDAKDMAYELGIKCIDGEDLVRVVEKYDAMDILDWYASGKPK